MKNYHIIRFLSTIMTFLLIHTEGGAQGIQTFQSIRLYHPNTQGQYIGLVPPSSITSYNLTLPNTQGSANSLLLNDGSGNLSWNTVGGFAWGLTGNSSTSWANHFLGTTDNVSLRFRTNNAERMILDSVGRLAVGVSTSLGRLHTQETINAVNKFVLSGDNAAPNTKIASILFNRFNYDPTGNAAEIAVWRGGAATEGAITFSTNPGGTTGQQPAERMRITEAGNVGIGTTAPTARLHVKADVGSSPSLILHNQSTSDGRATMYFQNDRTTTQVYEFGLDPGGSNAKKFQVRNVTTNTWPFTITNTDNVGIGTVTPTYRLDIDANTGSTGNPLRLQGLQAGATSDSLLTSASGVVRRLSINNMAWGLVGNSGTVDGTNFIGTTDNIPLNFRVNNQKAGRIGTVSETYFGYQAGMNTTGINNTFVGFQAGVTNTTGFANTGIGFKSLQGNTTGVGNAAIGEFTLYNNTTGGYNMAMGGSTLFSNTTGSENTAIGAAALFTNTAGTSNVAIGRITMYNNTTGTNNVALGSYALYNNTTAWGNTAVGYRASNLNTTGQANVAVGDSALFSNTTGNNNVGLGYRAAYNSTTSSGNVAVGYMALYSNTTSGTNTAVGTGAGYFSTSLYNTYLGYNAGYNNTTGASQLFLGFNAGFYNTTGNYNVFIGSGAGFSNTTASNNQFVGYNAGYNNTSGTNNLGDGFGALYTNTTGSSNTALGYRTLYANTTGNYNLGLGFEAGLTNTTGSNNTFLGYQANAASAALTNATAIGSNAVVGASNSLVLGGTGTNAVNVGINTTTPQYRLDIDANTGSTGNPLRLQGLQAGATSDSLVTSQSGVLKRLAINQLGTGNFWKIGGNTEGVLKNFGTTDNYGLPFITNNVERMRITEAGNVGIGTSAPTLASRLNVIGGDIVLGSITPGLSTFPDSSKRIIIRGDNGDNSDPLAMYAYYGSADYTQFRLGVGDNGNSVNDVLSIGSSYYLDNSWVNWATFRSNGLGINTMTPAYKLDIDANTGSTGNPLRLQGLQAGATSDSLLSSASGVVKRLAINELGTGNFWKIGGNTEGVLKNFGTTDNYALPFLTNNVERMRITETGNIGIGTTTPSEKLYVAGNIYATGTIVSSDSRFKKNIQPIADPLQKVMAIKGVSYEMRLDEFPTRGFKAGTQIGFIAQDLEKVVPEVVSTQADGYKGVDYERITALLVEAVKQQQQKIEQLEKENNALKNQASDIEALKKQMAEIRALLDKK